MNKITRRKSPRFGASKSKTNPFENRGMDKFHEVYSELEKMRAAIAAQEGVSTADVWFTRGTSKGRDWIPVVVGKSHSSVSSQGGSLDRLEKNESLSRSWEIEEEKGPQAPETEESQSGRVISSNNSPYWCLVKGEHIAVEMQQAARKAFKAVALFVMIAAAVADVLIAVAAGVTSSFIAKHLRPLWARYLPLQFPRQHNRDLSFAFPLAVCSLTPSGSSISAPTSPRLHQLEQAASFKTNKVISSFSTPASPARNIPTFFSSERPQEQSESPNYRQQQPHQHQKHPSQTLNRQVQHQDEIGGDTTPVMLILLVILFALSIGKVAAAVLASLAWFAFPVARKWSSFTPSRTGQQHNGLRKGHSV